MARLGVRTQIDTNGTVVNFVRHLEICLEREGGTGIIWCRQRRLKEDGEEERLCEGGKANRTNSSGVSIGVERNSLGPQPKILWIFFGPLQQELFFALTRFGWPATHTW